MLSASVRVSVHEGRLAIEAEHRDSALMYLFRDGIDPRSEYDFNRRAWMFPLEAPVIRAVCLAMMIDAATLPPEAARVLSGERDPFERDPPSAEMLQHARDEWQLTSDPLEHQPAGLAWLIQEPKFLLAWDMGLGKTLIGIARIMRILRNAEIGERQKILVICPKPMLDVWEESFRQFARQSVFVFDSDSAKKSSSAERNRRVVVTNYDMVWRQLSTLRDMGISTILADEVHRLKDSATKTAKAAAILGMGCRHRWGFSGTPFPNGPMDVHGVMTFIDPGCLGVVGKTIFKTRYCVTSDHVPGKVVAVRNAEELQQRIATRSSTCRKEQVLTHLPPKTFSQRACDLSASQSRIYRELREDSIARLGDLQDAGELTVQNVLSESLRLLQVVGGFVPNDDGEVQEIGSTKMSLLEDLLEDLGTQPAVIWTAFAAEAVAIQKMIGEQAVLHFGQLHKGLKQEAKDGFKSGRYRYLVSTSASLKEGVTLVKSGPRPVANAIYYSRNYALLDWLQSRDRIHRIGQEEQVTIYTLLARNTVDMKIDAALNAKANLQNMLLDGGVESFL